jgi:enediyne biosynthesis protein E4
MGVVDDTSPAVRETIIAGLRDMPPWRKLEMVASMSGAVHALLIAGIRGRRPGATHDEIRRENALLVLGPDLAARVPLRATGFGQARRSRQITTTDHELDSIGKLHVPRAAFRHRRIHLLLATFVLVSGVPGVSSASEPDHSGAAAECAPQAVQPLAAPFFTDISEESGIQDENFVPDADPPIPANDHSRLAFVDLNGDGYDDIVTSNMTGDLAAKPFQHLIYMNNGDGTFNNWSDESGLRHVQSAFFAFGDVDNDGDQDAFAGVDGSTSPRGVPNRLYMNDGTGRFTLKEDAGFGAATSNGPLAGSGVFADFDGDGNLDLFVANGATSFASTDQLYMGNGDGTFTHESTRLGQSIQRPSNGSVACDYDNDGDLDIFVSVYGISWQRGHNVLWENDGTGRFTNVARARGFEALSTGNYFLSATGRGRGEEPVEPNLWVGGNGFGLSCEDVNNDGLLDIWFANISHPDSGDALRRWSDPSQLLLNRGPREGYRFENAYLDAKLPFNEGDLEASVADFDNDGRPDLGMTRENKYESRYSTEEQKGWFGLFHQQPDGTFLSVGMQSGINDATSSDSVPRMKAGHSNVWSDIDRDGDLDLLVGGLDRTGRGSPNYLFRNDAGSGNAWLAIELDSSGGHAGETAGSPGEGAPRFNRDAIGARVQLKYGDRTLTRELKSSRGMYNSSDTRVLQFGLGELGCPTSVTVTWPNGEAFAFDGAEIGQNHYVTLRYGDGEPIPIGSKLFLPALHSGQAALGVSAATGAR